MMMRITMVIISLLTVIFVSGQSVLFIGFYSKAEPGVDYWCRKSEIVKQIVASEAEAQQLAIEFKKEHKEESPYVKIIKKGAVVLFEFQRDNRAFHCKYRVIGFREGKTIKWPVKTWSRTGKASERNTMAILLKFIAGTYPCQPMEQSPSVAKTWSGTGMMIS